VHLSVEDWHFYQRAEGKLMQFSICRKMHKEENGFISVTQISKINFTRF